ncbi:MAG: glycosyltransferase family 39 protein [Candidatus Gastranaerophilales bacterium]|nr:glycosyltransferase family 39 protein [Candidatus Gastranaerophilales bacterium]
MKNVEKTLHTSLMLLFLFVGIFARGWMLGKVPGGINQDEAFSAYEAYSLLHYGIDSSGYSFPVYLNTWGSGMSALNTYLMIPFIAIFGPHMWVIRIPQFIVACVTLYVTYKLMLKLFDQQMALMGLLLLGVCPWHIMMARWGMDANFAPGFLLLGFYFFVLGAEKTQYFLVSVLFYGLSLYCYVTIWLIVPLMIVLQLIYLWYTGKLHIDKYEVAAVFLLALLALPLILFLLINYGYMEEIRTPFLSIPKLEAMRKSEISLYNAPYNFLRLLRLLWDQGDGLPWNATEEFGLYGSKWMLVFAVIGLLYCCKRAIVSIQKRKYDGAVLLLAPFGCAGLLGGLIDVNVNVNRINCIHIPIVLFIAIGVCLVMRLLMRSLKKCGKYVPAIFVIAALIFFLCFEKFYFTDYRETIGCEFQDGLEEAVYYAQNLASDEKVIFVDDSFNYPKILFYGRLPVTEYLNIVRDMDDLNGYFCGQFHIGISDVTAGQIYIIPPTAAETFQTKGCQVQVFDYAAVAY